MEKTDICGFSSHKLTEEINETYSAEQLTPVIC